MPPEALVPTGIDCRAHRAQLSKFPHEGPLRAEGPQGQAGAQEPREPHEGREAREARKGRYERSATAASGETIRKLKDSSR